MSLENSDHLKKAKPLMILRSNDVWSNLMMTGQLLHHLIRNEFRIYIYLLIHEQKIAYDSFTIMQKY